MTSKTDYALELTDDEAARYRMMAEIAAADEAGDWSAAGIVPGAAVADIGCGPGAILAVVAEVVGPSGHAVGVDRDPQAVAWAGRGVAGSAHAVARVGPADDTGLEPRSFDVAMCRHVLAHNGGGEAAIVGHLATLVKPGGAVYLVDVDMTSARRLDQEPELDIDDHYRAFHARRGADLTIGLRLGSLLEGAGLEVERYRCVSKVQRLPVGMRGPQWAAREAMVAEGIATPEDVDRWDAAFERMDRGPERPWTFIPIFVAVGRQPG